MNCKHLDTDAYFDITRTVSPQMQVYPKDPQPAFEAYQTIRKDKVNVTRLILGSHTGTHVDAPSHFIVDGDAVSEVPISRFIGEAVILDVSSNARANINAAMLDSYSGIVKQNDILLLYSGSGGKSTGFSYLDDSAAGWIIEHSIKCLGTDSLSVEQYGSKDGSVHKLLLSNDVGIIENLDDSLGQFVNRRMFLFCLPLLLAGVDGAPARAVLFEMIK